jgi:hypothetical protein
MLGLIRIQRNRMSGIRNTIESLYGYTGIPPTLLLIYLFLQSEMRKWWFSIGSLVHRIKLIMFEFCSGRNPRRRILSTIIYRGCIRTLLGPGRRSEGGKWGLIWELRG